MPAARKAGKVIQGSLPRATVILPTYRRPDSLARALDALAGQEDPGVPWDLIVIDNDGPPGAEETFRMRSPGFPVPARLVREDSRGSAYARNRGIAEATGDIVVMIDDDVVPAPDWLARLLEPILAGRCDATAGMVVLDPAVPRPRWFDEKKIGGYVSRLDLGPIERYLGETEIALTANAAWRADLLQVTGGFDPRLGPRGGIPIVNDDALLARKYRAAGGTMRYVPGAVVMHEVTPERLRPLAFLRRAYYFGRSEWMMEREKLERGRANGARVALASLLSQLRRRAGEGLQRPDVAFHAAVNVARTVGSVREAVSWMREGSRDARQR
jgi:glucosyl-dolichyl phosphate glucuronosyltransferase